MKSKVLSQLVLLSNVAPSFLLNIYCGDANCYEILGVRKKATTVEIKTSFEIIEQKYHSDQNKDETNNATYQRASTAYNVLKNVEMRKDYDSMLDNPNNLLRHYYKYYKRTLLPNLDIQRFVVICIIIISVVQYFFWKHLYSRAVLAAMQNPTNRKKCIHKIQEERLLQANFRKLSYWEEEKILRKMVEKSIRGKYTKPKVSDTLFIQILYAPYNLLFRMKPYTGTFFHDEYEDMPSYQELKKFNDETSTESLTPLNECTDEYSEYSKLRTEMWLNNKDDNNNEEVKIDSSKSDNNDKQVLKNSSSKNNNISNNVDVNGDQGNIVNNKPDNNNDVELDVANGGSEKVKKRKSKKKGRLDK